MLFTTKKSFSYNYLKGYKFPTPPTQMKLNQVINFHKGLTPFVVFGLMTLYGNYMAAPWIYLSLHGTYGVLWLIKEKIFPDANFKDEINLLTSITGFLFLGSYWIAPFILISSYKSVPAAIIAACVSINIFGVFLHFTSDAQKYFMLQNEKKLIDNGFFKRSRNTNYFGETLIYLSFAILSMSWIPVIILGIFFFIVFLPRMLKKDKSLSKYPLFKEYKKSSGLIIPKFNGK
tara:strand:- start:4808 stop:5503 length:696 start_codon:yes stop_codon:yes gene_type:complete